jgi:hypothetical protein
MLKKHHNFLKQMERLESRVAGRRGCVIVFILPLTNKIKHCRHVEMLLKKQSGAIERLNNANATKGVAELLVRHQETSKKSALTKKYHSERHFCYYYYFCHPNFCCYAPAYGRPDFLYGHNKRGSRGPCWRAHRHDTLVCKKLNPSTSLFLSIKHQRHCPNKKKDGQGQFVWHNIDENSVQLPAWQLSIWARMNLTRLGTTFGSPCCFVQCQQRTQHNLFFSMKHGNEPIVMAITKIPVTINLHAKMCLWTS